MTLAERTKKLQGIFSLDKNSMIDDEPIDIRTFYFEGKLGHENIMNMRQLIKNTEFCNDSDNDITQNRNFRYTIFTPRNSRKFDKAILLLHGLNERSWEKYLTWAEYLTLHTNRPVILFPIAFHMNRTPQTWIQPRWAMPWSNKRRMENNLVKNSTFCNMALSERISQSPLRFYVSGRESVFNISQLLLEIENGENELFTKNTHIDIFSYSIGTFISQILLMSNPYNVVSDSKLFSFCGGSIFEDMNGSAKDIMDNIAFDSLKEFYLKHFIYNDFEGYSPDLFQKDDIEMAFRRLISTNMYKEERENIFKAMVGRIKMITLKKDSVIPTNGAIRSVGEALKDDMLTELDFPYSYSHQIPFPMGIKVNSDDVKKSFLSIFEPAVAFFSENFIPLRTSK